MSGQIITLHPVEFELDTSQAAGEFAGYAIAPFMAIVESAQASIKAGALPLFRKARVTVHISEKLIAALQADDAFDLLVEYER